MSLGPGTRLGPYEIVCAIGAGGMGEVYRARDTRLDRTVAIKILPEILAADPQFRARFEREAKAFAALTHPHICTLHDVGRHEHTDYLVMEHLEGQTLAERVTKGALPLDQALQLAIQIAGALDQAHRACIVHRDLKPANIMLVRKGGSTGPADAKLLDFGLAKVTPAVVAASGLSIAPTGVTPVTMQGTILGTLQYMAPEQIEGQEADARTDIFAFGCVLYEMLTGRKAFEGKTQASLIGAILKDSPIPVSTLQPLTSPIIDRIVSKCLAKDPDERWQSAHDLRDELRWVAETGPLAPATTVTSQARTWSSRARWGLGALGWATAVLLITLGTFRSRETSILPAVRFSVPPPEQTNWAGTGAPGLLFSISPDGTRLAFATSGGGGPSLWVRPTGSLASVPLRTEGLLNNLSDPFWSPDSRFIGFLGQGGIRRVDANGGSPQTIATVSSAFCGATWGPDGTILFSSGADGLFRVSADGGDVVRITKPDSTRGEQHRSPFFLPDGKHFLYTITGPASVQGVYVGSLDSSDSIRLLDIVSRAVYAAPGYLLYVRDGTLLERPFDQATLRFSVEPSALAEGVAFNAGTGIAAFSASNNGVLAVRGALTGDAQLTWFDRAGRQLGTLGPRGEYLNPRLSSDGKRVAVERVTSGNRDVWLVDVERAIASRFTFDSAPDVEPVWSPDGSSVLFASSRPSPGLYQRGTSGGGDDRLISPLNGRALFDMSSDGRFVAYQSTTNTDLWVLPVAGERKPFPFLETPAFQETHAAISPNGRWIAYVSNESGSDEVYVQRFPAPGGKQQVSTHGGGQPRWRHDGRELFYIAADQQLSAVEVTGVDALTFGSPSRLFPATVFGGAARAPMFRQQYDVTPDGQRFLLNVPAGIGAGAPAITVVANWRSEIKR